MAQKKTAVMIYPFCSLQEITCLTSCLALWYDREMDVFASTKEIVRSEDGFHLVANKTFDEFVADDYDCLILPGILNMMPALFDAENIAFLSRLKDSDIIIAAICSAPLLLAKAGLLTDRRFCCSVYAEMLAYFDFVPKQNVVYAPTHVDGNIVTAVGFAFREFAVQVMRALGLACEDDILQGVNQAYVPKQYAEEELIHRMDEEDFRFFLEEYSKYAL